MGRLKTGKNDNNRRRLLFLLSYLFNNTDEEHPVSMSQMLNLLKAEGIEGNRNTVTQDIHTMNELGIDIIDIDGKKNAKFYYYGSRPLELAEIKILIDAVCSSQFINTSKSEELVRKITMLAGKYDADKLKDHVITAGRNKAENPQIFYIIDTINQAIDSNKKIRFQYCEYDLKKERVKKNDGEEYIFSPYSLIWYEDRYYMLGFSEKRNKVISYRVDRMYLPEIMDEDCAPYPKSFNLAHYMNKHPQIFNGVVQRIELLCPNYLMNKLIDRFGTHFDIEVIDEQFFKTKVISSVSRQLFGWLFEHTGEVWLIGPENVKKKYTELIREAGKEIEKHECS